MPTALRLVTGNPGKRRARHEPKPRRVIPSPPAHLSPGALVIWGQLTVVLDRMHVLTEADPLALERLCETALEVEELKAIIAKEGRTQKVQTKAGKKARRGHRAEPAAFMIRQRPEVAMLQDADRRLRAWLTEFGLTPSARSRVHPEDSSVPSGQQDPLEKYFQA